MQKVIIVYQPVIRPAKESSLAHNGHDFGSRNFGFSQNHLDIVATNGQRLNREQQGPHAS